MKRLYVPLTSLAFEQYRDNGKEVEVRRCEGPYGATKIILDRAVELRHVRAGRSLWGVIVDARRGTLDEVISAYGLRLIDPCCANIAQAVREHQESLGEAKEYIAFRLALNK